MYRFVFACVALALYSNIFAQKTLKEVVSGRFLIGAAMNARQITGEDTAGVRVIREHFNAITAENCMKAKEVHPQEGLYDFSLADAFVNFGEANGMTVTGHCLIWHSQAPDWFFTDKEGNDVTPEVLRERMREHITTVVSRYKDRVTGWDVVNEAFMEDGSYRQSKYYEILGEEYLYLAFKYAHEADPQAELYYNDYNMHEEGKREAVIRLVNELRDRNLRIDAVGLQGHLGIDYPSKRDFEASIIAFDSVGVKVMITEWDMSALPTVIPTSDVSFNLVSEDAEEKNAIPVPSEDWNRRMKAFFKLFIKHSDKISRVTTWGVADGDSWRNNFPIKGRTDYPLLFDRNHKPKPFLQALMEL